MSISCSKEQEQEQEVNPVQNFLKIGNDQTDLVNGRLVIYVKKGEFYSIYLTLFSAGLDVGYWSVSGKGSMICFEICSSSQYTIANGTYRYSGFNEAGTFGAESYITEGITFEDSFGADTGLIAGTLVVSREGTQYEFTFNCTDQNGRPVSGYYKGAVKEAFVYTPGTLPL